MTLREKQSLFTQLVGLLIERAYSEGYELTFGDAYRSPEKAAENARGGTGIANSLHTLRLAIDLNLFRDGVWLQSTEDFRPLGEFWESLATGCCWGGRFNRPDGNHFSIEHNGVK